MNGIQRASELRVSPQGNARTSYDVDGALVVDHLKVPERRVDMRKVTSKWPHLSDLKLPEADGSQVSVLLGSDVAEIIVPLEVMLLNLLYPWK